ncbi:NAD(P)H-quinone oxidoreductase [Janibacter massiliensis]|uniref:NAD(P)H-quinone oxidoreductase n=1 Tax=Janibacter massiliensis TaxID=2058291 RepID=UPI000D10A9D6|nr:NAD(P)H-quinone oxidoreductase [Janibacter massiliensis]
MKAIEIREPGDADVLVPTEVPDPAAGAGQVVIEVVAAGVNRADVMQRMGFYPPPPGASPLPGLEVSGRVVEVGAGVTGWSVGDEACALLDGGGYAERVAVPAGQLLPIPDGVALRDAAALPEVACTVWSNLVDVARLAPGETVLVHGGTSGIGTFAIQLAKARGCRVAVTAGTPEKLAFCRELGADVAVNYREDDFVEAVREATDGRGADVVLDSIGAKYLSRNVDVLATGGRLVVIGLLGGRKGELDLAALLGKRGSITATSLRARDPQDKARIVAAVRDEVWPLLADGSVRPVVHSTHPLAEAAAAHREMESSTHVGKILLLP